MNKTDSESVLFLKYNITKNFITFMFVISV